MYNGDVNRYLSNWMLCKFVKNDKNTEDHINVSLIKRAISNCPYDKIWQYLFTIAEKTNSLY